MSDRETAITAIMTTRGSSRDWAEGYLNVLSDGLVRRSVPDSVPTEEQIYRYVIELMAERRKENSRDQR